MTLKLNERDAPLRGRAEKIARFFELLTILADHGPDFVLETRTTLRESWSGFLSPSSSYLAPIRQILREKPALRSELLLQIPELEALIDAWDLEPDG